MPLTDLKIKTAHPREKLYHLTDGSGLFLAIQPNGSKLWRWKYRFHGEPRLMALGIYPDVGLADARKAHAMERAKLLSGIDPMAERKAAKSARRTAVQQKELDADGKALNPFREIAAQWLDKWKSGKAESYAVDTEKRLERDVLSRIGDRPIASIKPAEIANMILAIEGRGAEDVARRALQNTQRIFRYALAFGLAEQNPAAAFRPADILKRRVTENFARVELSALPNLLRSIDLYDGSHFVRLALQLMSLVFVRTGEMMMAQWTEIDQRSNIWTIPAERMKMRRPHVIPLSNQASGIISELQKRKKSDIWVFPGERSCPYMNKNSMLVALKRMGYKGQMTGHGFRGLASTILNEMGYERSHIEMQLAHAPKSEVEGAYNKALYLPQRRIMMQGWADFLDKARKSRSNDLHITPQMRVKHLGETR